jgi:TatA/E family protein of Tat protein translocase
MGPLGGPELFLILVVALIVFGPRKLPEIGKSLGKMMGEFRRASYEFRHTIESEVEAEKVRDAARLEPLRPPTSGPTASSIGGSAADAEPATAPTGEPAASSRQGPPAPIEPE